MSDTENTNGERNGTTGDDKDKLTTKQLSRIWQM